MPTTLGQIYRDDTSDSDSDNVETRSIISDDEILVYKVNNVVNTNIKVPQMYTQDSIDSTDTVIDIVDITDNNSSTSGSVISVISNKEQINDINIITIDNDDDSIDIDENKNPDINNSQTLIRKRMSNRDDDGNWHRFISKLDTIIVNKSSEFI